MKDLKLLEYHFLLKVLFHEVANLAILHLKCYAELIYVDILSKQNKFTTLSQDFLKYSQ